jgi:hypothetical protein
MCPVVDDSKETAQQLKPIQVMPANHVAGKSEARPLSVHDHPEPSPVYDDMATCG